MRATEGITLFLYGTLLDPGMLARHAGRKGLGVRAAPAWLPGYRRVSLREEPYPTLLRGRGVVHGVVLRVRGPALARLSAYEGPRYRLLPLHVRTRTGPRRARAWIAPAFHADPLRSWAPHTAS